MENEHWLDELRTQCSDYDIFLSDDDMLELTDSVPWYIRVPLVTIDQRLETVEDAVKQIAALKKQLQDLSQKVDLLLKPQPGPKT